MFPWIICCILAAGLAVAAVWLVSVRRSIKEVRREFSDRLADDTNNPIFVSSWDREVRRLAGGLNEQLKLLRKQRTQYLQGDRNLKEAITNVSHDLRTPLTAIFGYLDLMDAENKSEDVGRYISVIRERAENLASLTEELFSYSVITSEAEGQKEESFSPVNICAVLEESVSAYYSVLKKRGIEPVIIIPDKKVICRLDRYSLIRVYSNILSNAVKYSSGDLFIRLSENGQTVFSNSALNLSETQVGRLFDRFYTVETARRSTGLGLAIARTLVERMKGEINAEYTQGKLSIYVKFPLDDSSEPTND